MRVQDQVDWGRLAATGLEIEDTLRRIAQINRFDIRKLYDTEGNLKPIHLWDDDTAAAISHIGRNGPVPFDKGRSLEMSMKHLSLCEKDNDQKGESQGTDPAGGAV